MLVLLPLLLLLLLLLLMIITIIIIITRKTYLAITHVKLGLAAALKLSPVGARSFTVVLFLLTYVIASNKYTGARQFRSRTPLRPARKARFARDKIINRFREGASLGNNYTYRAPISFFSIFTSA